jgi:hypothetical protein
MKVHTKRKHIAVLLVLMFALLSYGCFSRNAHANPDTVLKVVPSSVSPATGTNFTISVIAENVSGLYGWEFVLTWTPGVINCTKQACNMLIWGEDNALGPWMTHPIDNVAGEYHQSVTATSPGTPQTGTFWLVNVTFYTILGQGNLTTLHLQKAEGYTAYCLIDDSANEIPHLYQDGNVDVVPEFPAILMLPLLMILSTASLVAVKSIRKRK